MMRPGQSSSNAGVELERYLMEILSLLLSGSKHDCAQLHFLEQGLGLQSRCGFEVVIRHETLVVQACLSFWGQRAERHRDVALFNAARGNAHAALLEVVVQLGAT